MHRNICHLVGFCQAHFSISHIYLTIVNSAKSVGCLMYTESVKLENIGDKRWVLLKSRETGKNIHFLDILLCRLFAGGRGSRFKTSCSFHRTRGPPKSHGTFCFLRHRLPPFHSPVQLLSQLFLESFRNNFWGQKLASGSRDTQPHME